MKVTEVSAKSVPSVSTQELSHSKLTVLIIKKQWQIIWKER